MNEELTRNVKRLADGSIDYRFYTIRSAEARSEQFSIVTAQMGRGCLRALRSLQVAAVAAVLSATHTPPRGWFD